MDNISKLSLGPNAYIAISTILVWVAYHVANYLWPRVLVKAPLLFAELDGKSRARKWTNDCASVVQSGYQLFRKGLPMFRVTVEDGSELIVLSQRYLKEIKSLPDSTLDIEEAIRKDLVSEYSHIKPIDPIGQNAIRSDLTPGLPRLMPLIASEAAKAIKMHFPQNVGDWIPVAVFETSLNAVAQVSARLFVGKELCRDEQWIRCSQTATTKAFQTANAIKRWPFWMRPFIYRFLPEVQALEKARAEGKAILMKTAAAKQESQMRDKEDVLLSWIAKKNSSWAEDYAAQADLQLELSVVAIHTTTLALTHLLFDLAAHPEYVPMLRDEINDALADTGGVYNKDCIAKMLKTDSVMKESQRMHPPQITSFKRRIKKDVTLSDGTIIPKGATIEVDSWGRYHDPDVFENPAHFDGLRFWRLREKTQEKALHQFVSSNNDYIFWGQGKHACPGRFFAANEIKTLLAMFLLNYDIALPEGCTERPADISVGSQLYPNPTAQILVKRIKA